MQTMTALDAVRYVATHHHRITAWMGGLVTGIFGMAVETATGNDGLGIFTQLGVAGLIVVVLLYAQRQKDGVTDERVKDLKAQIDEERRQREQLEQLLLHNRKDND